MNIFLSKLKSILRPLFNVVVRPAVNIVRKRKLSRKLLYELDQIKNGYAFSKYDIDLYVHERFVGLSPMSVADVEDDAGLVKVTIEGKDIYWPNILPLKDLPWLHHEIFDDFNTNPSSYEHPSINFKNRKWVLDAGAAEGYFSVFSLLNSPALVIAVEPLILMRPALKKTLNLHANGRETIIVTAALADKPGWSEIHVDYDHICDSKLRSTASVSDSSTINSETERIKVITIDELALQYVLGAGGLIKMDIEGYEMAALSGAQSLMKEYKPALAIAVYHDIENARKCADIIKAANSSYKIEFRGCYGYFDPPRPYMLFAY
jgi:FkbM family methyltransferase